MHCCAMYLETGDAAAFRDACYEIHLAVVKLMDWYEGIVK